MNFFFFFYLSSSLTVLLCLIGFFYFVFYIMNINIYNLFYICTLVGFVPENKLIRIRILNHMELRCNERHEGDMSTDRKSK